MGGRNRLLAKAGVTRPSEQLFLEPLFPAEDAVALDHVAVDFEAGPLLGMSVMRSTWTALSFPSSSTAASRSATVSVGTEVGGFNQLL